MMRQPSPAARLYAWHRAALAGHAPGTHDGDPECGWYKARQVRGGPYVPVEIRCEREIDDQGDLTGPERIICIFDGQRRKPDSVWTYLTPITRREYVAMIQNQTKMPVMAATMARVDLSTYIMRPPK